MKTRFAPSPTGQMHLGNVRTALFCYLLARHGQGHFLLRIEDTDQARSQSTYTDLIKEDLQWLGLSWDEGPFWQSQRQAIYAKYYQQLEQQGDVYPCFCSDEQLALSRKLQLAAGQPPRYARTCHALSPEQIQNKITQGIKPTLRFHVAAGQEIIFDDVVKGAQRFRSEDIGDFIIRRADGSAAFFFCNAIDDADMGVTHVLRGEDHLTNTPRQILLLKALGLTVPHYGHLALIVGHDGSPLSKRHGSRSLQLLREEGYLPEALNNYLGRLGHYYTETHLLTMPELATHFALERLGKTPAHFDEMQLLHWQKTAVTALNNDNFWHWLGADVHAKVPADKKAEFIAVVKPNTVFPRDALSWAQLFFEDVVWTEETRAILRETGKDFFQNALQAVEQYGIDYAKVTQFLTQQLQRKGKALFQPLRVALTGQLHGPELVGIFALLGKAELLQRLMRAIQQV